MTENAELQNCLAILEGSSDCFLLIDLNQNSTIGTNKAASELLGYEFEELLQTPLGTLFSNYNSDEFIEILKDLSNTDSAQGKLTTVLSSKSGQEIPVDVRLNSINVNNTPLVVVTIRDITESSKIESLVASLARTPLSQGSNIFYQECVKKLSDIFQVKFAFIGLLNKDKTQIKTLSVWAGNQFGENFEYNLEGTPCSDILDKSKELIPCNAANLYPEDELLSIMGVESYFGAPLVDSNNEIIGIVSVMDTAFMVLQSWGSELLGIYAARIAAELEAKIRFEALSSTKVNLDEVVDERTNQLRAVNKELESFSYSISHDLRAPLRSITGFADALRDEYKYVLDDTGLDYLQRIIVGGERMGRLIDDLLSLSRITRTEIVKSEVNLSLLAEESMETLRERNPDKSANVQVIPNIMGNADPGLIGVVMSNLMNNAWKYSQKSEQIDIMFGAEKKNGETVYYVKDNGVGFKMQYADKIFTAFQRLHSSKDYEGTGIGLATVQRIIHRHGGQVWAKSELEKGATFYFTLH